MDSTGIEKVIAVIDDMKVAGIVSKYAVGGAFAATLLNEPIATIELDIFFFLTNSSDELILSLAEIYDYAKANGFHFDHEFISIHGWLVQFVEGSHNQLWSEAIKTAQPVNVGIHQIPVIDAVHLVAMWLFAGRAKDYQKIAMFLESGIVDCPGLKDVLNRHGLMVKWNREKWRFIDDPEQN